MDAVFSTSSSLIQPQGRVSRSGLDDGELCQLVRIAEPHLRSLAGASILITGATGWFGVWLLDVLCAADDLLELGVMITAVSREPRRFLARFPGFSGDPRINWIESDVRQLAAAGPGYSHVIHAAAETTAQPESNAPSELFESLVDGTRRAIAAAGSTCKSFMLLSSGAVYGPARQNCARFVETEPNGPDSAAVRNVYAEGKRTAEQICAIAGNKGLPVRIARCFAFVGPHMPFDKHFAIGNFIADAVRGQPIRVKSDGRPQRSYLYMTDLMRALLAILTAGSIGRPYNVGSDISITIEQLANCVNRVAGGCGVVIEGSISDPSDRYVPDTTRLRTELNCAQRSEERRVGKEC